MFEARGRQGPQPLRGVRGLDTATLYGKPQQSELWNRSHQRFLKTRTVSKIDGTICNFIIVWFDVLISHITFESDRILTKDSDK